ncbi:MAG TPA: carbon monoxide dehydrogenase subunit G [Acidiphilium sp.]
MDMTGERLIAAPREAVWVALNDPEILQACIPGCESIEKLSDTEMKAVVNAKIGPISSRFNGRVTLADLDPPNSYTISGEGQGGVAGFAKGGARVALAEEQGATRLRYQVNAQVGGKMAQLGARLIDSVAKSYAETFFTRFVEKVAPETMSNTHNEPELAPTPAHTHEPVPAHAHGGYGGGSDPSNPFIAGLPAGIWIPIIVSIVVVTIVLTKFLG